MNAPIPRRVFSNSTIRRATVADIDKFAAIAENRYFGRNVREAIPWVTWCVENKAGDKFAWVGEDSFIIAHIYRQYGFELRVRVDILCTRPKKRAVLEAFQLLKACKRWAALNGVTHPLRLDADTGVDFGPFAKRLGGWQVDPKRYPVYEIPLDGGSL